jgi:hypothetical protein
MPTEDEIKAWTSLHPTDGRGMSTWLLATIYVVTKEINLLRAQHGLPARTKDQVVTAIRTAMDDLTVD